MSIVSIINRSVAGSDCVHVCCGDRFGFFLKLLWAKSIHSVGEVRVDALTLYILEMCTQV